MRFSVELNQDTASVDIDEADLRKAYKNGGSDAVDALVQGEIDMFVNNNVCAVALDSEIEMAIAVAKEPEEPE